MVFMSKVLFVIAKTDFRDEELFHTLEEVKNNGFETIIASSEKGECSGSRGGSATAELSLNEVSEKNFDAIVFVGGGGAAQYFKDEKALQLVKNFFNTGKIVAAICIAPSILANAGILKKVNATSFYTQQQHLEKNGAVFTGKPVEVSGKIVTANGPSAARLFGKKISELLKSE